MFIALAIVLVLVSVICHEAAHAYCLQRHGIRIERAGLGAPFGPRLTWQPRWLNFPLTISPILIMAYVQSLEEDREKLDQLSYMDQAECYGAAPIVNVILGVLWLSASGLQDSGSPAARLLAWLLVGLLAVGLWCLRRIISAVVIPLVGAAAACEVALSLMLE